MNNMKNWLKKWFIAAGAMIAAGVIICAVIFAVNGFDISAFNTSKERIREEKSIQRGMAANLYIETSSSEVILKKTTDRDDIHVTYYENEDITYDFIDTDGTLKIIEKDNKKWYQMLKINFSIQDTPLIVEIPEDRWEEININTSSGDILIDEINCQELNTETSSGEIKANNLTAKKEASFDTSSGDIDLFEILSESISIDTSSGETNISDINNSANINIESSSGDISIKNSVLANQLTIDTSSGETEISNVSANNMNIESSSGDIEFSRADASDYKIDTSSGDVFGTIKGDNNTVSFITETSSGDVSVPNPSKGEKTFSASTLSGDIEIAFSK